LIFRAVSLEFRGQVDSPSWRRSWDWAFGLGSLVPAILFGVAIGNVLRGLPVAADGSLDVSFFALLNPYSLLVGALTLAMFVMHGAAFLGARTEGDLQQRMARWTTGAWTAFVVLYVAATLATFFAAPYLFEGILGKLAFWILAVLLLGSMVSIPIAARSGKLVRAFLASCAMIASLVGLMGLSLYPRMVPSSIDLAHSLTIYNASSTPRTLTVMLVIALVGMPLVIVYTSYVYAVFMGKVVLTKEGY
jgi:cytochrome d ubiquinol oxidase subunit II